MNVSVEQKNVAEVYRQNILEYKRLHNPNSFESEEKLEETLPFLVPFPWESGEEIN